eukprot:1157817-Pelagomonas_calceolata.AAC.11
MTLKNLLVFIPSAFSAAAFQVQLPHQTGHIMASPCPKQASTPLQSHVTHKPPDPLSHMRKALAVSPLLILVLNNIAFVSQEQAQQGAAKQHAKVYRQFLGVQKVSTTPMTMPHQSIRYCIKFKERPSPSPVLFA